MKLIISPDCLNALMSDPARGREDSLPAPAVLMLDSDPRSVKGQDGRIDIPLVEIVVADDFPAILDNMGLSPLDTAVQYIAVSVSKGAF